MYLLWCVPTAQLYTVSWCQVKPKGFWINRNCLVTPVLFWEGPGGLLKNLRLFTLLQYWDMFKTDSDTAIRLLNDHTLQLDQNINCIFHILHITMFCSVYCSLLTLTYPPTCINILLCIYLYYCCLYITMHCYYYNSYTILYSSIYRSFFYLCILFAIACTCYFLIWWFFFCCRYSSAA